VHRVVPPPGDQAKFTRWSLVFFLRPSFDEQLYPLNDQSEAIKAAAAVHPTISKIEPGQTNSQWFKRRIAGQRAANRTGPESWKNSRGTECEQTGDRAAGVLRKRS
jgi:isopenicillin N synthase-like dioxygenase